MLTERNFMRPIGKDESLAGADSLLRVFQLLALSVAILVAPFSDAVSEPFAKLLSAKGQVQRKAAGKGAWQRAKSGTMFYQGDSIRTLAASRAAIRLTSGGVVRIGSNSQMTLQERDERSLLDISEGRAYLFSRDPKRRPLIATPVVSAAIRGTEVAIVVAKDGKAEFFVLDGQIALAYKGEESLVGAGQKASLVAGKIEQTKLISIGESVSWLLRYPVIFSLEDFKHLLNEQQLSALKSENEGVELSGAAKALALHRDGQHHEAWKSLNSGSIERSVLLLALFSAFQNGELAQAEEIRQRISAAGFSSKESELINGLLAASALLTGNNKELSRLIPKLKEANSVYSAYILSVIQQASGNLENALIEIDRASKLDPSSATISLHRAEILLALGRHNEAKSLLASYPKSARTLSLQGFAELFETRFQEAESLFAQAIEYDREDSDARLGLALCRVYREDYRQAREQLELAASLRPEQASYRSYLGKLYFETDRDQLALNELEQAMQLDPKDPTPYFYRAFVSRAQNKPVAALKDLNAAIARNDNRAVYRSRYSLDRDRASRSANVGRIYQDLRFEELAQLEAARTLRSSYLDYSGHFLLAESFNTFETANAAIASERAAEVLAPLSFNALRGTSSPLSLNEYSTLFEKESMRTQVSTLYNSDSELFDSEVEVMGRTDSLGAFLRYRGSHAGSPDRVDSLSEDTEQQALGDFARSHFVEGTLRSDLSADDHLIFSGFFSNFESSIGDDSIRPEEGGLSLSYTRDLEESARLIVDFRYLKRRGPNSSLQLRPGAEVSTIIDGFLTSDETSLLLESEVATSTDSMQFSVQHIYEPGELRLISGYEYTFGDLRAEEEALILENQGGALDSILLEQDREIMSALDERLHSHSLYSYLSYELMRNSRIEAGLSADLINYEATFAEPFFDDTNSRSRLNPKLGLFVEPIDELSIRLAYFQNLSGSFNTEDSSLQPVLLGGINQRFTDEPADQSENYGFQADLKLDESGTFLGIGALRRNINRLFSNSIESYNFNLDSLSESYTVSNFGESRSDIEVDQASAYWHQIWAEELISSVSYRYFDTAPDLGSSVESQIVSSRLGTFSETMLYGFAEGTWRRQETEGSLFAGSGNESFWVFDATLGYRFENFSGAIELEFQNIFDEDFLYDNLAGFEEFVRPNFATEIRASLNF